MTQKLRKLIKIRNIAVIIALVLSCLSLVQVIVTNSNENGKTKELEQEEISEEKENTEESGNIEDIENSENEEVIEFESIVQGFRDTDLPDGKYVIAVKDERYTVELINYYDDVVYTEDVELGDDTTEYKTLVVKYHKNLTINEGVTVTAKAVDELTYKKGMYLCVLGNIYNEGTISMTARGTYNCEGQNVYLWKNIDDSYEYVPAVGAIGGASLYTSRSEILNGNNGQNGIARQTGGGGTGAGRNYAKAITIGAGGTGTSYSGGAGSGAANSDGSNGGYPVSGAGSSIRRSRRKWSSSIKQ